MKHLNLTTFILIIFLTGTPALAQPWALEPEPPLHTQVQWTLNANGLLIVGYDLDLNGTADLYTVRSIHRSYSSDQPDRFFDRFYEGRPVFYSGDGAVRYVYITSRHPLLYARDINEDGVWEWVYQDVMEDGVNGNEKLYNSPSEPPTLDDNQVANIPLG